MNIAKLIKQQQKQSLDELIEWAGSRYMLAKKMNLTSPAVDGWHNRGRISKKGARKAERLTSGIFKKEYLRPDVISWRKK